LPAKTLQSTILNHCILLHANGISDKQWPIPPSSRMMVLPRRIAVSGELVMARKKAVVLLVGTIDTEVRYCVKYPGAAAAYGTAFAMHFPHGAAFYETR
jgi:hypothetical protein